MDSLSLPMLDAHVAPRTLRDDAARSDWFRMMHLGSELDWPTTASCHGNTAAGWEPYNLPLAEAERNLGRIWRRLWGRKRGHVRPDALGKLIQISGNLSWDSVS